MSKCHLAFVIGMTVSLVSAASAQAPDQGSHAMVPGTTPANSAPGLPIAPDWAYPDSSQHKQLGPPPEFHRATRVILKPIGIFEGQADVGAALVPGRASFKDSKYSITSAGYNIWYTRDEFRYLWKRMSGDVSIAADIKFPNPAGFGDRKAVLILRQTLNDDSKEAMVALHGDGMIHIAQRAVKGARITDMEYRIGSRGGLPGGRNPDSLVTLHPRRIGIQKNGRSIHIMGEREW